MENNEIELISNKLNELVHKIENIIDGGISKNIYQPEEELYFRWRLKDFKYGDKGIVSSSAEGEHLIKKSWIRASIKIKESVKESPEHQAVLQVLRTSFSKNQKIVNDLDMFISRVIYKHLHLEDNGKNNKTDVVNKFIDDLLEKPAKYSAEIQLQGIVLRSQRIEPIPGIVMRQPIKGDLEKEIPFYGPASMTGYDMSHPSAIANIEFLGRQARDIQIKVQQMIVILRLFKTGSINYLSYRMYSDSITDMMARATMGSSKIDSALETSIINEDDEEKIKSFWETIGRVLPPSLYEFGEKEISPVSLAYDRYSDALMHNGLLERRIANVVMGLEALLLDATQELSYRLGLRVAKIISLLGDNPQEVRQVVKDAYNIRNLFAHGSHLSYQQKKKLELTYKDIKNIFSSVINYLRRLIVVMILIRKSKDEFIDLVDDSLIDKKKEELLNNLLSGSKRILG